MLPRSRWRASFPPELATGFAAAPASAGVAGSARRAVKAVAAIFAARRPAAGRFTNATLARIEPESDAAARCWLSLAPRTGDWLRGAPEGTGPQEQTEPVPAAHPRGAPPL